MHHRAERLVVNAFALQILALFVRQTTTPEDQYILYNRIKLYWHFRARKMHKYKTDLQTDRMLLFSSFTQSAIVEKKKSNALCRPIYSVA